MDTNNQAYPKILDYSKDLYFRCDLQGRITVVTDAMVRMLGYDSAEDAKGLETKDFWYYPEKREAYRLELQENGIVEDCEMTIKKKDGSPLSVEISCRFVHEENGAVTGIEGVIRDVTGKHYAQDTIREHENRYRSVFEATLNPITVTDKESLLIVDANQAACKEFGYTKEEFLKLKVTDISAEPEKTKSVFLNRTDYVPLRYFKRKDGSIFPAEVRGAFFEREGRHYVLGSFEDISARLASENELKDSEEKYRSIFESVGNPFFLIDPQTKRVKDVNQAACDQYGYSPEEMLGMEHADISAEPEKTAAAVRERAGYVPLRYHKRKDGSVFPIEAFVSYYEWHGKEISLVSIRDISQRVESESKLRESEEKYRTIFESVANPFFLVDPQTIQILDVNQAACDTYGYSREEMLQLNHYDLSTEPEKTAAVAKDRSSHVPLRLHKRKDGTLFPVEVLLSYCEWQGKEVIIISVHDIAKRLQSENVLKDSEEKYRSIFESVGNPFFLTDPSTTKFLDVNQAACDVYGYTREEMLQFDQSNISADPKKTAAAIKNKDTYVPLRYHKRKDGSLFPIEAFVSYYQWQGREISLVSIRDITQRVNAEKALRESEARYKGVVDSQIDIVLRFGLDGQPRFANEAWHRIMGKPLGLSDRGVQLEFVHPEDVPTMRDHVSAIESPPHRDYVEIRLKTLQGYRWYGFESYMILDENDQPFEGQVVGRDIHDNKLAAEAIRINERRLSLATEAASEGVWEFDVLNEESYISPQIYTLLGYDAEDINQAGTNDLYLIHPEDYITVFDHVQANIDGELDKIDVEFRLKAKSGDYKWVHNRGQIIERAENGYPVRIGGTITDVTEARIAREALEQAHNQLRKSFEVQKEFLNCITHEVRTPLIAVKGYAEMLMEGLAGQLNEQQWNYVKKITESSESLLSGVTAMLEMTRINSGKTDLAYEIFEPHKLVSRVVSTVAPQAIQKGLHIKVVDCGCASAGATDATKLTVVLGNLLSNAVKFTDNGSVEVHVESDGSYMTFGIFDTGRGIDHSDFAAIFEEFRQLKASRKYKETGFGIGLSLVAAMVDVLGAELTLSSIKNVGSVFTLQVPILHPSAAK